MKRLVALTAAFAAFAASAAQEKLAEIEVADTSALIRQAAKLGDHCGMPVIGMVAAEGIRDNILSNKFGPMREGETLTAVVYGDAALLSPSNIEAFAETLDLSAVYPCEMTKETFLKEHPNATETNGVVVLPGFDRIIFSPDGRWVATGGDEERARLVLAEAGRHRIADGLAIDVKFTEKGLRAVSYGLRSLLDNEEVLSASGLTDADRAEIEYACDVLLQSTGGRVGLGVSDLGLDFAADSTAAGGSDLSRTCEILKPVSELLAFAGRESLVAMAATEKSGVADQSAAVDEVLEYLRAKGFKTDFVRLSRDGRAARCELDAGELGKYVMGEGKDAIGKIDDPAAFLKGLDDSSTAPVRPLLETPAWAMSLSVKGTSLATTPAERFDAALPELRGRKFASAVVMSLYAECRAMVDGMLAAMGDDPAAAKFRSLTMTLPAVSDSSISFGCWKEKGVFRLFGRITARELKNFTSAIAFIVTAAVSGFETTEAREIVDDGFVEEPVEE